jgi:hypothetical protein
LKYEQIRVNRLNLFLKCYELGGTRGAREGVKGEKQKAESRKGAVRFLIFSKNLIFTLFFYETTSVARDGV